MNSDAIKRTSAQSQSVIEDFVLAMENKGLSRDVITDILSQAVDEVEAEIVIDLMEKLTEEKKQLLDALISQGVPTEEIAAQLELNPDELEELESEKFIEILQELTEKM